MSNALAIPSTAYRAVLLMLMRLAVQLSSSSGLLTKGVNRDTHPWRKWWGRAVASPPLLNDEPLTASLVPGGGLICIGQTVYQWRDRYSQRSTAVATATARKT